jgi:hypothetical protein
MTRNRKTWDARSEPFMQRERLQTLLLPNQTRSANMTVRADLMPQASNEELIEYILPKYNSGPGAHGLPCLDLLFSRIDGGR